MKKLFVTILAAIALACSPAAQAKSLGELNIFNHLGVGVHAATTGFGVELATPVTPFVALRGGVSIMPGFSFNTSVDGEAKYTYQGQQGSYPFTMDVKGDLSRVQGNVIFNIYPFGSRNAFYLAAGAYFGGSRVLDIKGHTDDLNRIPGYKPGDGNIIIGDYELPVDADGNVHGELKVKNFRPYLGLGFGRAVPTRRVNFGVELGVQFMDSMRPYVGGEELAEMLTDNNDDWQKWMDKINVYPVLKFTISGRIF